MAAEGGRWCRGAPDVQFVELWLKRTLVVGKVALGRVHGGGRVRVPEAARVLHSSSKPRLELAADAKYRADPKRYQP